MPTDNQNRTFYKKLKDYKNKYLKNKYSELDESATRLMINSFLSELLEFAELDEIRTEQMISGTYADYIIQVDRKKHLVIEVKAIQIDLSDKHLRQAVNYAANEGIDWVLLTNGRQFELYKVIFKKPITQKRIFSINLKDEKDLKEASKLLILLQRKFLLRGDLENYWKRFQTLEPNNLCKYLYSQEIVRFLRRTLKQDTTLSFSEADIFDSIHEIIVKKIDSQKPKNPTIKKNQKKETLVQRVNPEQSEI